MVEGGHPSPADETVAEADPAKSWAAIRARDEIHQRLFGGPPSPQRVGAYEIEAPLGSGGNGVVYSAFDPRLRRRVAIKLIRASGSSEAEQARRSRLLTEAQALAHLEHPNVVTVHDVGVYDDAELGRRLGTSGAGLFVVMELVEGETLAQWLDAPRPWHQVVAVLLEAGRGLMAAHAVGILHRDFKPSNVAIARDGRVRVLDFGLARVCDADAPSVAARSAAAVSSIARQLQTAHGTVMGTPPYMAPEQHTGKAADERTDVYGYCVTLWEALTGERPFVGSTEALLRAKRDGPPTFPAADHVPSWLVRVVLRGLRPRAADRWPNMEALVSTLERGLERQGRRTTAALATPVLALAALGVHHQYADFQRASGCTDAQSALVGVWDPARRMKAERAVFETGLPYVAESWATTVAAIDDYAQAWVEAHASLCRTTHERDPSREGMGWRCLEGRRAQLETLVDLLGDADKATARGAVASANALEPASSCAVADGPATSAHPQSLALARAIARAHVLHAAGKDHDALAIIDPVLAELAGSNDHRLQAEAQHERGRALFAVGDRQAAEDAFRSGLTAAEIAGADRLRLQLLASLTALLAGYDTRYTEAQGLLAQADAVLVHIGEDPRAAARLHELRGLLSTYRGDFASARMAFASQLKAAQALEPPDPLLVAAALLNVGRNLADLGDPKAAIESEREALELRSKTLGPEHPDNAVILIALGFAANRQGNTLEELRALERALTLLQGHGDYKSKMAMVLGNLSGVYTQTGDEERARESLDRALVLAEEVYGPSHPNIARYLTTRSALLIESAPLQAAAACRRALEIWNQTTPDNPDLSTCHANLGEAAFRQDEYTEALEHYARGLAMLERVGARQTHGSAALLLSGRARVLIARGDLDTAIPVLEEALQTCERQAVGGGAVLLRIHEDLARALELRDPDRAERHRARARMLRTDAALEHPPEPPWP